MFAQK